MFEIDVAGLAELEGGKPPQRLAFEPVANVFDEYRGYQADRKRPSFCAVTLKHSANPRGVLLTVADDGAGFAHAKDIWTLFGSTAKRSAAGVSGRFNLGEKQLVALAREATIKTNNITVRFADGKRDMTTHRQNIVSGTIVEALMPAFQKICGGCVMSTCLRTALGRRSRGSFSLGCPANARFMHGKILHAIELTESVETIEFAKWFCD